MIIKINRGDLSTIFSWAEMWVTQQCDKHPNDHTKLYRIEARIEAEMPKNEDRGLTGLTILKRLKKNGTNITGDHPFIDPDGEI
jgi:hypothetical protein